MANYFGYQIREPFEEERKWFLNNLQVTAYASDDLFIVINPYTKLNSTEMNSVCINEAIRLFMRENKIVPKISLTKEQKNFFINTPYEGKKVEIRQTIIARIIAKDPSAQNFTKKQFKLANEILNLANKK
jgi:hypothetical protein